jgi:hypothetical protein
VQASLSAGRERGAAFARALIQTGNIASQITFKRCGFKRHPDALGLYVAPCGPDLPAAPAVSGHLLSVNTINYRGLWLEEAFSEASLTAARAACSQAGADLVGVLVSRPNLIDNKKTDGLGFSLVGEYQWWNLSFQAGAADG